MTKEELNVLMADVVRPMYKIEQDIGMPMNTLQRAMKGTKRMPKKWTVKFKDYISRKKYLTSDIKTDTKKIETSTSVKKNSKEEEVIDESKLTSFQLYQRKKLYGK